MQFFCARLIPFLLPHYLRHYPQHSCPTPPPFLSTQLSSTPLPNALLTFAAPHPCPRGTAYVLGPSFLGNYDIRRHKAVTQ